MELYLTEFIMFGTPRALQSVSECTVSVGEVEVKPSKTVRNIGANDGLSPYHDIPC